MLNSQRIFVQAIRNYCAEHGLAADVHADGWLVVMRDGARRKLAFAYDLGLNSAVAHRIANDKSATSDVLTLSGIACVPHTLFLSPELHAFVPPRGSWEAMLALLGQWPDGLVVKPNEGTSGKSVFWVTNKPALELAVKRIFSSQTALVVSPFLDIEDEVRVVVLDGRPLVVYAKDRPAVTGDGKRSLLALALDSVPAARRSTVLPSLFADLDRRALDAIVPAGERRVLNWRHNLENGAEPALMQQGEMRDACVALAARAAQAIGIRFASVDVVRVNGSWQVLEVNSGVMMEALSSKHPELVQATYSAALHEVFAEG
jgi:glutathione synthase/RimK-type ligase-like ATP-grasp enzyme